MKKILLILGLIIVAGVCLFMFFYNPDKLIPDNPAGKTIYYTMITGPGSQGDSERYNYELTAYNEEGEEKQLSFSAGKQLREGAYLQLYYTRIFGVRHWEEITFEELPKAVQQLYQE
ncbi:YxeA family protein [Lederbergia ruris]|uniref:YxeA family protein n=1 Tax=Lederbergia ruris TaxID=217495 RepID=UPI0039A1A350